MPEDELPPQSLKQMQILFAADPNMVRAAIEVIKTTFETGALIGDSEYATIVNAVKFDTQQNIMLGFMRQIDIIREGGLHNQQRS